MAINYVYLNFFPYFVLIGLDNEKKATKYHLWYKSSQLKGARYDGEDLIHPDDLKGVKKIEQNLKESTIISLTRMNCKRGNRLNQLYLFLILKYCVHQNKKIYFYLLHCWKFYYIFFKL